MAEEPKANATERLFRERRLLLGVSLVLLAHQLLGINVGKGAETLGLHFEIDNPERLFLGVWVVWLWTFISYVQQLNSIRPFEYFPHARQKAIYERLCDRLVRVAVTRRVRASYRRQVSAEHRDAVEVEKQYRQIHKDNRCIATEFKVRWRNKPDDPRAVNLLDDTSHIEGGFTVHGGIVKHGDGLREHSGTVWIPLHLIERRHWVSVAAVVWTWTTTSFAVDYLVPVGIGLAPPAIASTPYVSGVAHELGAAAKRVMMTARPHAPPTAPTPARR